MIKLQVEPYCHKCCDFEADVVNVFNSESYDTIIKCEHRGRCMMIANYIKEEMCNDIQREVED